MPRRKKFDLNKPTPEITDIGLMLGTIANALGEKIVLNDVITDYQNDLKTVVTKLRANEPLPTDLRLFVPDLWHIAKGRAKSVPKEEAERLYQAQIYGHDLGEAFMERDYSNVTNLKNKYPGSVFRAKRT